MALANRHPLARLALIAGPQCQTLFPANMSTSHYSRPYRPQHVAPNTRKHTGLKIATLGTLLIVDMLALIGSTNIVESCAFAALVIVNLWALNWTRA